MNDQKKLKLSKETLRCLDDDALTDVVGGGGWGGGGGGGHNSNNCFNSNNCGNSNALICISEGCSNYCSGVVCVF